jgi:hypothetical protein
MTPDAKRAITEAFIHEPMQAAMAKLDTLSDLRRLLTGIEYGDMMKLANDLATVLQDDADTIGRVLHSWATGLTVDALSSPPPSSSKAPEERPASASEALARQHEAAQQAHHEKLAASRAARVPAPLAGDYEEGSLVYDDSLAVRDL